MKNQIYDKLEDMLNSSPEKTFAVFDFDNTCIVNDIGEAVLARENNWHII